jgi:hypothetical protein
MYSDANIELAGTDKGDILDRYALAEVNRGPALKI